MYRRGYLKQIGAGLSVAGIGVVSGCIHSDPGQIENYLEDIPGGYPGPADRTDSREVTIEVGAGSEGHYFYPPHVEVRVGATVIWKWTGKGGAHNVVCDTQPISLSVNSGPPKETGVYKKTITEPCILFYYCERHQSEGIRGAVTAEKPGFDFFTEESEYYQHCGKCEQQQGTSAPQGESETDS